MSNFTAGERPLVMSSVAALTIKRIPESDIIEEIQGQTNKTVPKRKGEKR